MTTTDQNRTSLRFLACSLTLAILAVGLALPGCGSDDGENNSGNPATKPAKVVYSGPPTLTLEDPFLDVGVREPGSTMTATVTVRNTGGEQLVIKKAVSACECFKPSVDIKTLESGQTATLTVTIDTKKRRGEIIETIGIQSNDPAGPAVLPVRFEVPDALTASPAVLHLGVVKPGQTVKRSVKIVANRDVAGKVLYAIARSDGLVGRVTQPNVTKDQPAVLEIELKAPAQPGTHTNALAITTVLTRRNPKDKGGSSAPIALPVTVCVSAAATLSHDRIDLGRFTRGQAPAKTLTLNLAPGTTLKAVKALSKLLTIKRSDADGASTLRISPADTVPYGTLRGSIRLELAGKENAVLTIPVTGFVTD